jgi:hypothetical protein
LDFGKGHGVQAAERLPVEGFESGPATNFGAEPRLVTDHHIARSSHDHVELKGRHTDSIRIQESRNAVLGEHGAGAAMALNVDGAHCASEKGHGQEGKDAELHPTKMAILAKIRMKQLKTMIRSN